MVTAFRCRALTYAITWAAIIEGSLLPLTKALQSLFIALFALLQCVAPLVHAHVDGINSDSSAHAHELRLHIPPQSDLYISLDYAQQADAAVIELPHELQRNDSLAPDQAPIFASTVFTQPASHYIYKFTHRDFELPQAANHLLPDAQAPPR